MRRFGPPPDPSLNYTPRPGIYAIILKGRKILLTEQSEPGLPMEIQLPGGGIDPGEQRLPALHREVKEETGWKIAPIAHYASYKRYTYMPEYSLNAMKIAHIYLCLAVRKLGPPDEPHHKAVWADLRAAPGLLGPAGDAFYLRQFIRASRVQ